MERLTTDTPKDNFEMALNLFYVKDKEVWVRGYGKGGADISLLNLTREILSHQCPYEDGCSQKQVWERLKAYEDTGLTPEEIKAPLTENTMINLAAQALW